jgi:hypothetical protein
MPHFIYSLKAKHSVWYNQWRIKEVHDENFMTLWEQLSGMDIKKDPLIQLAQDQTGTELLNILVYQMEPKLN